MADPNLYANTPGNPGTGPYLPRSINPMDPEYVAGQLGSATINYPSLNPSLPNASGFDIIIALFTNGAYAKDLTGIANMVKKFNYVMYEAKNGIGYGTFYPDDVSNIGHIFFWIAFGFLSFCGVAFFLLTLRREENNRRFHYCTTFSTFIGVLAYFSMARGQGSVALFDILVTNGNYSPYRVFYYARFIDWTFSTVLTVLSLSMLAGIPLSFAAMLMFADAVFVICGLFGCLSTDSSRWGWWGFSLVSFAFLLVSLVTKVRNCAKEKSPAVLRTYTILVFLLFFGWPIYPVLWILGQGTKSITVDAEVVTYAVTDCVIRGFWGFVLLLSTTAIEDASFEGEEKLKLPPTYTSSTIYQGVLEAAET
mmetsp:Transcript_14405/g.23790  ORF Transcript_14405/g.23790 Transcript_14405/m.23790 type:complete len:365 (+) Transcript_14405:107-1201(+)|eukprot:CAMPEP_0184645860 /NCGR_PEP_ID=MMETSP0308-20130426/2429_1 /TAXON_ID=38269 /ORGANISM="Gloeochaete witrockiana, Strain SAG 46.84" /LENGTH=364 /DNA_ID=CAMNT_0027075301 /DNA_START=105 /DNA_END=1199 /DNA_ORIENTATION=-